MLEPHLRAAADLFILDNEARRLTARTQENYRWCILRFIEWCELQGVVALASVTPQVIRTYMVYVQTVRTGADLPLAPASVHNLIRVVRRFFGFCLAEELLPLSPFRNVRMPTIDKKVLKALTPGEVQLVLRACSTRRDKAIISFLVDSGVRAAEFCALTVGDVDTSTGAVLVRFGKGQKQRVVYVGTTALKALGMYLIRRGRTRPSERLFQTMRGKRAMTPGALVQLMRKLRKRCGVANLTCHGLRRTFAITCLRNGMDLHTLRALMGHSDLEVLRQYLDFAQSDLQSAHKRFSPLNSMV